MPESPGSSSRPKCKGILSDDAQDCCSHRKVRGRTAGASRYRGWFAGATPRSGRPRVASDLPGLSASPRSRRVAVSDPSPRITPSRWHAASAANPTRSAARPVLRAESEQTRCDIEMLRSTARYERRGARRNVVAASPVRHDGCRQGPSPTEGRKAVGMATRQRAELRMLPSSDVPVTRAAGCARRSPARRCPTRPSTTRS